MKILVLFVCWDEEKTLKSKTFLNKIKSNIPEAEWHFLHILNHAENKKWEKTNSEKNSYNIGGNNSYHEFSGWQKGWNSCQQNLDIQFDMILMCNDAILNSKPYNNILQLKYWHLEHCTQTNSVIGWVDTFSRVWRKNETVNVKIFDYFTNQWLCSNFIIFPLKIFKKIQPLLSFTEKSFLYFREFTGKPFRKNSFLSENYKNFLIEHQSKIWYKKYILNKHTYPLFIDKTTMCINEHILGAKIFEVSKPIDLYNLNCLEEEKNKALKCTLIINKIKKEISSLNKNNVAIYGAGKHTKWLSTLNLDFINIKFLLDDKPDQCSSFWNLKPIHTNNLNLEKVDAIILSSDTFQQEMAFTMRRIYGNNIKLIKLY